jgi:hypothetical protein
MRYLLIVALAAAVVWLFIERKRLSDENEALHTQIAEKEKALEDVTKVAAAQPGTRTVILPGGTRTVIQSGPAKSSWLDSHIKEGAHALDGPSTSQPRR